MALFFFSFEKCITLSFGSDDQASVKLGIRSVSYVVMLELRLQVFYIISLLFLVHRTTIVRLVLEILVIKVLSPSLWDLCFYSCNRNSNMYIL